MAYPHPLPSPQGGGVQNTAASAPSPLAGEGGVGGPPTGSAGPVTMPRATRAIAFINCAHFADHFIILVYATAVIAMAPEFGLSYASGIALATGLFACFGLFSLPAGWLADRWSRRHMLGVFWLGGGASPTRCPPAHSTSSGSVPAGVPSDFSVIFSMRASAALSNRSQWLFSFSPRS